MIRFGLVYTHLDGDLATTADPARKSIERQWAEVIDHMVWAEELGFDVITTCEHHFEDLPPSPLLLTAAAAMRATRVTFSHSVMLAPLYHPVRLAEEAAMLSVLTNGRYDLTAGAGYDPKDFAAFDVNLKHRPSIMEETVEILRRAWTGKPFSFAGKRFTLPEIAVRPVPTRTPKIIIGASVPAAIQRAARIGDGFLSSYNHHIPIYVDELNRLGKTGTVRAAQQALIAEDLDRAISQEGHWVLAYANEVVVRGWADRPLFETVAQAVDAGEFTVWDGPTAVRELGELITRYPQIEEIQFMVTFGAHQPVNTANERIQYIAGYVMPRLKQIAETVRTPAA